MGRPTGLTLRQEVFCLALVDPRMTATGAARVAGLDAGRSVVATRMAAHRLLARPDVRDRIAELRARVVARLNRRRAG